MKAKETGITIIIILLLGISGFIIYSQSPSFYEDPSLERVAKSSYFLAVNYYEVEKYDEAVEELERIIKKYPSTDAAEHARSEIEFWKSIRDTHNLIDTLDSSK